MVNDDQVQGQEGVSYKHNIIICIPLLLHQQKLTSDVDNLEAGEGEDGEGV